MRSFKRAPTVPADEATRPLTVWAEKEFICARASLKPGRYLLFLRRVTDSEYVVVNHEYGARAVLKGMLDLSFYDRGAKQRPVTAFPAMLAKALPDGPSGPIAVKIAKSVIWANQWVPQQPMQKLYVSLNNNVRSWPYGLSWMVPALFSPTLLSRQRFERLTRAPHGTWKMVGVWRKGSFLLTSIEKI